MENDLCELFHPIVARPFERTGYRELAPGETLRPWVRCFWSSSGGRPWLVVPDVCTDLIFRLRPGEGGEGEVRAAYTGLSDKPFWSGEAGPGGEIRAVRFHFWSAPAFAEDSLRDTFNHDFAAGQHFSALERELRALAVRCASLTEWARAAEAVLLRRLRPDRLSAAVGNAAFALLRARGGLPMEEAAAYAGVGTRQLERLFRASLGVSPKRLARLVRYQNVFRDLLRPGFDVQDAVLRYGFTDQPHLNREFRAFHSMPPGLARQLAYSPDVSDFYKTNVLSSGILEPGSEAG